MFKQSLSVFLVFLSVTVANSDITFEDIRRFREFRAPDIAEVCVHYNFTDDASIECKEQLNVVCSNATLLMTICDPVMGDNGKMYVHKELLPIYKSFVVPLATILTPNLYEIELLTGIKIKDVNDIWKATNILHQEGCEIVVVTSVEFEGKPNINIFASSKKDNSIEKFAIEVEKLPKRFGGCGDLFASLLLAWLHKSNNNLKESLEKAVSTLQAVLQRTSDYAEVLDASSKFPYPGLGVATRLDYGDYDQCLSIDHTYSTGRVLGKHCPSELILPDLSNITDVTLYYQLSLCQPDACTSDDFNAILRGVITDIEIPNVFQGVVGCATKETNTGPFSTLEIIVIAIFVICIFLMVVQTIYDIYLYKNQRKCDKPLKIAFSVLTNGRNLLHISKESGTQIQTFHGLKVISMMWIIAGHGAVGWVPIAVSNNKPRDEWEGQFSTFYLASAPLAVDTFFFISGFLLAYQYLKQKPKPVGAHISAVPALYLHRYLRLTPALLMFYLFTITLFIRVGSGPVWHYGTHVILESCTEHWWQFLLYVQNYTNYWNICLVNTWYVCADMQMFLLSPFVLIPIANNLKKRTGFKISMIELFILNIIFTFLPMIIKLSIPEYGNHYDTHSRLSNYFVGMMLGTFMLLRRDKPFMYMVKRKQLIPKLNLFLWIIVLLGMLTIVLCYQEIEINHSLSTRSIFHSLMRPAWCIGLSWIVYSCYHGYGGFVNWVLCRPTFQILGKLTYCMYLLHVLTMYYYIGIVRTRWYFSDFNVFYLFLAHYVASVMLAVFWTLAFESPMIVLEKYMFGGGNKKKERKPAENNNVENGVKEDKFDEIREVKLEEGTKEDK